VQSQATKANSTRRIGLLMPGVRTTEVLEIIGGELASLARAREFALLWDSSAPHSRDPRSAQDQALQLCAQFIEHQVVGVFFAPFESIGDKDAVSHRIAEKLSKAGTPVVLLDRDLQPFPRRSNFDLVGIDNLAGGCLLAEHLIKLGCEHIAFVARPFSAPTINARIAGVREALTRQKLDLPADWIQEGNPEDLKFARGLTAGHRWDAVVCANDLTAVQLLRTLEQCNVRVPRDLRVVGFDDAKDAAHASVPLTTMRQPCRDLAVTAFRTMLERIAEPTIPARSLLLTPQLVVRESCGAYGPRK